MNFVTRLQTYFRAIPMDQRDKHTPVITPLPDHPVNTPPVDQKMSTHRTILACTPTTCYFATPRPRLHFTVLSTQSSLEAIRENLDTNARGFDSTALPSTPTEAAAFRAELITSRAITAKLDDHPVAAGMFTSPIGGVAELAGITTLTDYRGRGIGMATTSELLRIAFTHGVNTAILYTDNPVAYRIYQRLGFQPVAMIILQREQ
ncbi:MAG: hypothetical protein GFH27_549301n167 [Chloroflexi bacterium AL-W]|nr:hypothetical protein [Chloroflexi bacterium AL-N1]NOK68360.1 hypothetical protein [Chloroflexi bacterium AL-N10]NOK74006.1 hypothetical protein [Chloroflexi bacterium AL-N5]NOK82974.1 hypothetical protein [Chloroflexi bacterium AL-W]NOK90496.1 hypothetical protein [Chloroflexi bacterium AL-N15]